MVVRDMSRSLANFQTTDVWRAFGANAAVVEELFAASRQSGTMRRMRSASMDVGMPGSRSRSSSISSSKTPRDRSESVDNPSSDADGSDSIEYDSLTKAEILARVRAL